MLDKSLIGTTLHVATVDVERGAITCFARVIGETNLVYFDESSARAAGYRSLPVPPTFLFCLESRATDPGRLIELAQLDLGRVLHAEQQFDYRSTACAGDRLTFETTIADIYDKKGGALEFLVTHTRVTNQDGAHVADLRMSLVQRNA